MKLTNGDEVEIGEQKYRVICDELHKINKGSPPAMIEIKEWESPLDRKLIDFYLKKGYEVCPSCGGERNSSGLTGCGTHHNGTYCLV